MPEFHVSPLAYDVKMERFGSLLVGTPSQPFHGRFIRSTTQTICAIAIIPIPNGFAMNVEEAASIIKPAKARFIITMAQDSLIGMRNFDRSLHVPVVSISGDLAHIWCLSPGNPTEPKRVKVKSTTAAKLALSKVCTDSLVSRPLRVQHHLEGNPINAHFGSKENALFDLIAQHQPTLTLGSISVAFSPTGPSPINENTEMQRWEHLKDNKYDITIRRLGLLYLLISADFIIGFDIASFGEKRIDLAFQRPNQCPECQRVFQDPVYCPSKGTPFRCRVSQTKLTPFDAFPLDSPLIVSMPYERLEFFLVSRQPEPLRKNFGEIVNVWPRDVTTCYAIIAIMFSIYGLGLSNPIYDHFKGNRNCLQEESATNSEN